MNRRQTTRNVPVRRGKLLDSFFHGFLIIRPPSKNQTKTRPKPDRFRECEFFSAFPATAYNFSTLKRSYFTVPALVARAVGNCQFTGTPGSARQPCRPAPNAQAHANSARGRDAAPRRPPSKPIAFIFAQGHHALQQGLTETTCHRLYKIGQSRTLYGVTPISSTPSQRLTATRRPVVRFFKRCPMIRDPGLCRDGWVFIVPTA